MNLTLVTTWDVACGIAEHAFYLKQALEAAVPDLAITVETNLHPAAVLGAAVVPDVVLLNYHAALHSQWRPADVIEAQGRGIRVVIVYHDTGVPNSEQCRLLYEAADAFVVHEPCEDLPGAVYIRQGIPGPESPWEFGKGCPLGWWGQPIVGTVGFPFPWKNYDLLAEASAAAGWALLLIAPGASDAQVARWEALNPDSAVFPDFMDRRRVVSCLAGCDATAFLYTCANTGTSAAIRLGIAARKPVLASNTQACRQFRDLAGDPVGRTAIQWLGRHDVGYLAQQLSYVRVSRVDPYIVHLAHQDSWSAAGARYAEILRSLR